MRHQGIFYFTLPLMYRHLLRFYLWGSMGLTTEVCFTALHTIWHRFTFNLPLELSLEGNTYIWMFFIYGTGAFIFPLLHTPYVSQIKPTLFRILLMAVGLFAIEFVSGFLLDKLTGHCPWLYTSRWAVMGYIRLDYLPAWMLFSYIIEQADALFEHMTAWLLPQLKD